MRRYNFPSVGLSLLSILIVRVMTVFQGSEAAREGFAAGGGSGGSGDGASGGGGGGTCSCNRTGCGLCIVKFRF